MIILFSPNYHDSFVNLIIHNEQVNYQDTLLHVEHCLQKKRLENKNAATLTPLPDKRFGAEITNFSISPQQSKAKHAMCTNFTYQVQKFRFTTTIKLFIRLTLQ